MGRDWDRGGGLPYASAGDDAGIIPEPCGGGRPQAAGENARPTLRPGAGGDTKAAAFCQARRRADASIGPYAGGRPRRGRRTTAPTSAPTQGGCRSRRRCTYTLYCRAGVHARRGGLRRGDTVVLCKRRTARLGRIEATRKGIGRARCRTPQSADADSSPCRGAFRAASQSLPCKGRWMRRKAQTEGCIAALR